MTDWAFDSVLVANRGEIARRVIRTARRLGLRTVAVYSEADAAAPHVREADEAVLIGKSRPQDSYLNGCRILAAANSAAAGAIHPGYGFLSENADFARQVEEAGIAFAGPAPAHLAAFGAKHTARELARAAGVPMMAGTGLLASIEEAVAAAGEIGYPVMVKATGGGGGIGMLACHDAAGVADAFARVQRLAAANFATAGVFLERLVRDARHVEVQVFGDGTGQVVVLGDRDCSLQRRNQKVIEEAPAPGLPPSVRRRLHEAARELAASVGYRSAGTVEFVYDPERQEASFLEVNARLQVEHPVTEEVYRVDLVEQMLRLAGRGPDGVAEFMAARHAPRGHAVEARVYAEDPNHGGRPSPGLVTSVSWPARAADLLAAADAVAATDVRVDAWIEAGLEVSPSYDPLLAKVIAAAGDREQALDRLGVALAETRVDGVVTNLGLLRAALALPEFRSAVHSTSTLNEVTDPEPRIEVLAPGAMTTVQDWPGRLGYWQVGVPPSGPMDEVSLREANLAVGNPEGAPALECAVTGPALKFSHDTIVCLGGAVSTASLDGRGVPWWEPFTVPAGATLSIGAIGGPGLRCYLAVRGGFDVPSYLGSASTFTLGRFGGHAGRALAAGDVLRAGDDSHAATPAPTPQHRRPAIVADWEIGVTEGPHAAPEFFTRAGIDELYASSYTVHHNSARTGIRLIGPRPSWAREDGGEAGLHPSNIHDVPYAVGALDFTGDTPIILGPDGPSLGGFVCPAVIASGELWKTGQLRPGDTVRFVPVREADAASLRDRRATPVLARTGGDGDDGILARRDAAPAGPGTPAGLAGSGTPAVVYRRDGDDNVIVEYGDPVLDLGLRMRVHALQEALAAEAVPGIIDLTPGIRSLQIHTDAARLPARSLLPLLQRLEYELPPTNELRVPSRTVRLPLSWDDPATRLAIERYMHGVRSDAPWTPWNIEFIRRVNGLATPQDVRDIVFAARYLVLGLGDVYLGAPVATPVDPRHRLVTTKYNPARTWTAENSVGIGGAYLCIYGMEGPGGYQFVGRTTQVWNRYRRAGLFAEQPWALRFFDQIEWYPVSAEELLDLRAETEAGRGHVEVTDGWFDYGSYQRFLTADAASIAAFRARQSAAFAAEKERWRAAGEFDRAESDPGPDPSGTEETVLVPAGATPVTAPFIASVWQVDARPGMRVAKGDKLAALEAMKMETIITAPHGGTVAEVYTAPGNQVTAGQVLLALIPDRLGGGER
ncbi:urea carboxylase [Trebonia kvetii]|uniref:Urea carboxylase n=1 Tax=Trebonia kvetii TaxID=2480626 RepID=A0A6P2C8Q4_9ACTN|nr:urea carboxylase [Trebonia kvetii]TVZ06381.1 urea carboxylase [Trebonia kvetii]